MPAKRKTPSSKTADSTANLGFEANLWLTANLHQSRTLATLRDTLLPKLLSGELACSQTLQF